MKKRINILILMASIVEYSIATLVYYRKSRITLHNLSWINNPYFLKSSPGYDNISSHNSDVLNIDAASIYKKWRKQSFPTAHWLLATFSKHELPNQKFAAFRKFKRLLIIFFMITPFMPTANATDYYVATNGSDTNSGSISSPWKTIAKAAKTLVAGDSVYIRGGVYKEQITPKNSGNTSNGFITYATYPNETATVDASGLNWDWNGIFNLSNQSYIQISGLRIINSPGFGVLMSNSRNIKILNNYTYNTKYSGIYNENSDSITIDGNEVEQANYGYNQESISIDNGTNFIVSNNRVHDGNMEGIDVKVGSSNGKIFGNTIYNMVRVGIYVDAWDSTSDNIEIYGNIVSDSKSTDDLDSAHDGIRIGGEHGGVISNLKIYNNVLYNIAGSGVVLSNWVESGFGAPAFKNITISNNTTYKCGTQDSEYGGGIDVQGSSGTGIAINNNILSQDKYFPIRISSGIPSANVIINNNLIEKSDSPQASNAKNGTNAIIGSALFVNPANDDFHLQATSPAINAGTSTDAPDEDFELKLRPNTNQVDVGAYEYASSLPNGVQTSVPTAKPTAVPTAKPTSAPTVAPTSKPTSAPTAAPTAKPTVVLSATPTSKPTSAPTAAPTSKPTSVPTAAPTAAPSATPTMSYQTGALGVVGATRAATDVYQVTCATGTSKLIAHVKDMNPVKATLVSIQIQAVRRGLRFTSDLSIDPIDGDTIFSPLISLTNKGSGIYTISVNKSQVVANTCSTSKDDSGCIATNAVLGTETYTARFACQNSQNVIIPGTIWSLIQDQ